MALNSFSLHMYCRKNRYHGLGFLFFFPMVLVKPEIKPQRLEVGLRTTCTSQKKGAAPEAERGTRVHRYRGGWSSHPKVPAMRQLPTREMNRRQRGVPRTQTCFFRQTLGAPPARLQGLQVEGEMPWDSIEHLVRSSQGNGGSLVVDVAVGGERTPCSKSPGGSILGWHPLAPLPAASLCASIQGLHAAGPVPLTPRSRLSCPNTERIPGKKNPAP